MTTHIPPLILIVDDNNAGRYATMRMVSAAGFRVSEAMTGQEALALARTLPDLIILDIELPDIDGFEVCRRLKSDPLTASIPVLHLTAIYLDMENKVAALEGGADGYLTHPVESIELTASIKALLRLKLAEQAARQVAAYWQTTFDAIPEAICLLDTEGRVLRANATYQALEGKPVAESRCSLLGGEQSAETCLLTRVQKSRQRESLEREVAGRWLHMCLDPVFGETGQIESLVFIIHDNSEKKKLEAQYLHAQKMESIGNLAGGVAHDFNNILAAITGFSHLSLRNLAADHPVRENIEQVLTAANRAAALTKELLLFSRKQPSVRYPVDLNEILIGIDIFLRRIIGVDIVLKTNLHLSPLPVLADRNQLQQVLMNLAINARDAMPHGGELLVQSTEKLLDAEFVVSNGLSHQGRYALISISDSGTGMDKTTLGHIFEPFYTTKEAGRGTGLGLAVVYALVKQHEGVITVYSEPGQGASFHIYLPLLDNLTESVCPSEQESESDLSGTETILVAEDDDLVRSLVSRVLSEAGYQVIEAVDGFHAVSQFEQYAESIQLLLFDLMMPKMDGKEASEKILAQCPGMKVIFTSGYAPDLARQKRNLPADCPLLTKPASPSELLKMVRKVLNEAG